MKRILTLVFLSLSSSFNAICQIDNSTTNKMPSANAMTSNAQIANAVDLHRGIPQIGADITSVSGRGYSVPINLSYNSIGIKVQDVAGVTGLGWSMTANCHITRVVRGIPDENPTGGYFGSDMGQRIEGELSAQTLDGIRNGNLDSEPDMFFFNINGKSGKFVFDKSKQAVFLNNEEMLMLNSPFAKELGYSYWILGDIYGNRYYFGLNTNSTEVTESISYGETQNKTTTFTSTWYLNEIRLPNNKETIYYNYASGSQTAITYYNRFKRSSKKIVTETKLPKYFLGIKIRGYSVTVNDVVIEDKEWNANTSNIISTPKYLSSIVTSDESVQFEYEQNRQDLTNGWLLKHIKVRDINDNLLRDYNLDYFYTFSNDILNPQETSTTNPDKYRLFLRGIKISPSNNALDERKLYTFNYFGEKENDALPPRYSSKVDHWGYFNISTYGFFPDNASFLESSKTPHIFGMRGLLERITFENGGYKIYERLQNEYYDLKNKRHIPVGGYRIRSISTFDGQGGAVMTEGYEYSDEKGLSTGKISNIPPNYIIMISNSQQTVSGRSRVYIPDKTFNPISAPASPAFIDDFSGTSGQISPLMMPKLPISSGLANLLVNSFVNLFYQSGPITSTFYSPTTVRSFLAMNNIFEIDGSPISYSKVTVIKPGEGKIENYFSDIAEYPDLSAQYAVNSSFKVLYRLGPDEFPYTPLTSYAFARGRLKEQKIFNESGALVQRTKSKYQVDDNSKIVKGFKCETASINTPSEVYTSKSNNSFYIGYYDVIPKTVKLMETETEIFEAGNLEPIKHRVEYAYRATYPYMLKETKLFENNNSNTTTEYKYVADKNQIANLTTSEQDAVQGLYNDGSYGVLLETSNKRNGDLISAQKIGFKRWQINSNTMFLPETVYELKGGVLEPQLKYEDYDNRSNLLSSILKDKKRRGTIWDQQKLNPIIEWINAEPNEIFHESFENNQASTVGNAHTGGKYWVGDYTLNYNVDQNKSFKVSYWYYENAMWKYSGYQSYTGPGMVLSQGDAIDDVLVIPEMAQASVKSYSPSLGISSLIDNKGITSYFEYDNFQRLKYTKDGNKNIVTSYDYHVPKGPYFYNDWITVPFTKNDCPPNKIGEVINYYVPDNSFYSTVSKAKANELAMEYINLYGQSYANTVGRCREAADAAIYMHSVNLSDICNNGENEIPLEVITGYHFGGKVYLDEYLTNYVPDGYYIQDMGSPQIYQYINNGTVIYAQICGIEGAIEFRYSPTMPSNNDCFSSSFPVTFALINNGASETAAVGSTLSLPVMALPDGYYMKGGYIYTLVSGTVTAINNCATGGALNMVSHATDITQVCSVDDYTTYYFQGFKGVGAHFYTDAAKTQPVPDGYYYDGNLIYIVLNAGEVYGVQTCYEVSRGELLDHPAFNVPVIDQNFSLYYSSTRSDMGNINNVFLDIKLYSSANSLQVEIPVNTPKPIYYTDSEGLVKAPDGYYTYKETSPNHQGFKFYFLRDGKVIFSNYFDQVDPVQ